MDNGDIKMLLKLLRIEERRMISGRVQEQLKDENIG